MRTLILTVICIGLVGCQGQTESGQTESNALPAFSELEPKAELPDPLVMRNGDPVRTAQDWTTKRRPEIRQLFDHYMYGTMPPPPDNLTATVDLVDSDYFGGKATKKQITLTFGPEGTPPLQVLLVIPNNHTAPAPVFLGPNFYGNHTVLNDPAIPITENWVPNRADGVENNRATEAARGTAAHRWEIEQSIDRGYAVATFYHGDLDPDYDDFSNGVHAAYNPSDVRDPHAWGSIAAWAWGMHRVVDYLVTDADIDKDHIAVMGHSRNGKAALLAGAIDERIALVVSNQSGCGGAALNRRRMGETVKAINDQFPHWFAVAFRDFNEREDYLPLDQHLLIAMIAPRPVLVASAVEDEWADPPGEFQALKEAESVYRLLGTDGFQVDQMPDLNQLVGRTMGYHIRPGAHGVGAPDWAMFMNFVETVW